MADWKSIALLVVMVLAAMNAQAARSTVHSRTGCQPVQTVQTDAHRPVTYHFAVTNTTDKPQAVESVRTSCACLKVEMGGSQFTATETDAINCVPPGGVLPFEVVFDPAGMEGHVEKRVWVTLAPAGGSPGTARPTQIATFDVVADVRLRLGFKPMDAAFGVIRRSETGREIVAKLSGYEAVDVKLGAPYTGRTGVSPVQEGKGESVVPNGQDARSPSVFDVRIGAEGKSVVAKFCDRNVLPGIYSETWTIPTSDKEIPEIKFVVSARVADAVSVTPQVITVGWDEPVCSRMVMVRGGNGQDARCPSILSAETKPRKWGDVKITQRPMNGWRIDIENIDPREVRQFSKRPFLEVKTDLPGMETFDIPLRVVQDGGTK